jgi:hypothetical protein
LRPKEPSRSSKPFLAEWLFTLWRRENHAIFGAGDILAKPGIANRLGQGTISPRSDGTSQVRQKLSSRIGCPSGLGFSTVRGLTVHVGDCGLHPLPFSGGPIYAFIFWVTYALWLGLETIGWRIKRSGDRSKVRDRGSFRLLLVLLWVALALDFSLSFLVPQATIFLEANYGLLHRNQPHACRYRVSLVSDVDFEAVFYI